VLRGIKRGWWGVGIGSINALIERTDPMAEGIVNLSTATFDESVLGSSVPVLVDFWAEWCGPCKTIAPILGEIATEKAGELTITKLNVDENPEIAMRFKVMSIPTLLVFQDGQERKRIVGAKSKGALLEDLSPFLPSSL
jgi:thioredoxin 1